MKAFATRRAQACGVALLFGGSLLAATPAEAVLRAPQEPGVTRPSAGQNTWWLQWARPRFTPFYQVCFNVLRDGVLVASNRCTPNLAGVGADNVFQWTTTRYPVDSGHRWLACATEYLGNPATGDLIRGEVVCGASTLIDATGPVVTLEANRGQPFSRSASVPLRIHYRDTLSPPFPTTVAGGATFVCSTTATRCTDTPPTSWTFDPGCSRPSAKALVTSFDCTWSSRGTDGRWTICVTSADGAFADRPDLPDQLSGDARAANLAIPVCATLDIDTHAPTIRITAPSTARKGKRVALAADLRESGSGLSGPPIWRFDDGSPARQGANVTHRWRRTGRFKVTVAVKDLAGNRASRSRTIRIRR